jgi:hypothetical protein
MLNKYQVLRLSGSVAHIQYVAIPTIPDRPLCLIRNMYVYDSQPFQGFNIVCSHHEIRVFPK